MAKISSGEKRLLESAISAIPEPNAAAKLSVQLERIANVYREESTRECILIDRDLLGNRLVKESQRLTGVPEEFVLANISFVHKGAMTSAAAYVVNGRLYGLVFGDKSHFGLRAENVSSCTPKLGLDSPWSDRISTVDDQLAALGFELPDTWKLVLEGKDSRFADLNVLKPSAITRQEIHGVVYLQILNAGDWCALSQNHDYFLYNVVDEVLQGPMDLSGLVSQLEIIAADGLSPQ